MSVEIMESELTEESYQVSFTICVTKQAVIFAKTSLY